MAMLCAEYASCCGGPGEPTCCSHLVTERVLSPSDEPPRVQAEWKSPQCKFELRPIVARPKVIRVVEYVFPAGQSTRTTACIAMEWAYAGISVHFCLLCIPCRQPSRRLRLHLQLRRMNCVPTGSQGKRTGSQLRTTFSWSSPFPSPPFPPSSGNTASQLQVVSRRTMARSLNALCRSSTK